MVVELYSKRRCPLCDHAREVVEPMLRGLPVEYRVRHIEDSEDLWVRFRHDVPVVVVDGEVTFTHHVDPDRLAALLRARGMGVAQSPPEDA
jgi:glutaredoxin